MKKTIKATYLFLALVLILLSFVPIINVNAWGQRQRVAYRPFSDWLKNNERVVYGYGTNPDLLPEGFLLRPLIESPDEYCGFIKEKLLDDGRAEITVFVAVRNCRINLYGLQDWYNWEEQDILSDTKYCCIDISVFILPEPGMEIPIIFDLWSGDGGEWVSSYSIGFGYGIFTEYAVKFGFTPGMPGGVFLHMYQTYTPEGEEVWPYEDIIIFE